MAEAAAGAGAGAWLRARQRVVGTVPILSTGLPSFSRFLTWRSTQLDFEQPGSSGTVETGFLLNTCVAQMLTHWCPYADLK